MSHGMLLVFWLGRIGRGPFELAVDGDLLTHIESMVKQERADSVCIFKG